VDRNGLVSVAAAGAAGLAFSAVGPSSAPAAAPASAGAPAVHIQGPVETKSKPDPLARDLGIATAVVAIIGLPFVALQVQSSRKTARDERTASFVERFSKRDFQKVASKTLSFLRVEDAVECVEKLKAIECRPNADAPCLPRARDRPKGAKPSFNDLLEVFFFFEDFGGAYNRNGIARRQVRETISYSPVQFFTQGWWYICWSRGGKSVGRKPWRLIPARLVRPRETDLYNQFEWMVRALRKKVPAVRGWDTPASSGLVLCLPPPDDRGSSGDWDTASSFSSLLSACGRDNLKRAAERLEAAAKRRPGVRREWEVVVVPPSIDESRPQRQERQWLEDRLACSLATLDPASVQAALGPARGRRGRT
jgi:hypothetical protein